MQVTFQNTIETIQKHVWTEQWTNVQEVNVKTAPHEVWYFHMWHDYIPANYIQYDYGNILTFGMQHEGPHNYYSLSATTPKIMDNWSRSTWMEIPIPAGNPLTHSALVYDLLGRGWGVEVNGLGSNWQEHSISFLTIKQNNYLDGYVCIFLDRNMPESKHIYFISIKIRYHLHPSW